MLRLRCGSGADAARLQAPQRRSAEAGRSDPAHQLRATITGQDEVTGRKLFDRDVALRGADQCATGEAGRAVDDIAVQAERSDLLPVGIQDDVGVVLVGWVFDIVDHLLARQLQ